MKRYIWFVLVLLLSCARIERGESLIQFPNCPPGMTCSGSAHVEVGPLGVSASGNMSFHGQGPPHDTSAVVKPQRPPIVEPIEPE